MTVKFKQSFMSDYGLQMPDTQLAQLARLMDHMDHFREMLPLDLAACRRIAKANTRDEHRAFDQLMRSHFSITELGRMPSTSTLKLGKQSMLSPPRGVTSDGDPCDIRVTPKRDTPPPADESAGVTRKEDARMRQNRNRDKKEPLIEELRERGVSARRNTSLSELKRLLDVTPRCHIDVTPVSHERDTGLARAPGTPNTLNTEYQSGSGVSARGGREGSGVTQTGVTPTPAGIAVLAMKQAGLPSANPSHPELLALLAAGVTAQELADATSECLQAGKPVNQVYIQAMVRGRRREAAAAAAVPAKVDPIAKWGGEAFAAKLRRGELL